MHWWCGVSPMLQSVADYGDMQVTIDHSDNMARLQDKVPGLQDIHVIVAGSKFLVIINGTCNKGYL